MAQRIWETRELLILEAVVAAVDAGEDPARPARLAVADLDDKAYIAVGVNLVDDGYLDAIVQPSASGPIGVYVTGIRPKGRRATGQWPGADLGADLVATLNAEIEKTTDEAKKGRLRRLVEAVRDIGTDVASETLSKVIIHRTGG
jgi:hypothetical protein